MHRFAPLRLLILAILAARAFAAPQTIEERWYLVQLGGEKAGHSHERTERLDDGSIRVSSVIALAIKRGPVTVEVTVESESTESAEGEPVSMLVRQRLGAATVETAVSFDEHTATVVETQFGQRSPPRTFEIGGDALMPHAFARELERRIAAGEDRITLAAIEPISASVVESTYIRGPTEVVDAAGRAAPATRWTVEQAAMPGVETAYYLNDEGEVIRGDIAMGGIAMTMVLAERELALSENEPAELLVSTLVRPSRPIDTPRTLEAATYIVRSEGQPLPEIPEWASQSVEVIDEHAARVRVQVQGSAAARDTDRAAALESSAMIDATDPEIRALAQRVPLQDDDSLEGVARGCGRFVHDYINEKSLDVGFATASEVARTRQGDCTEHAVLLAAVLRARGIPARVVTGVIYVEEFVGERGIFGFHMWTQALLPDGQGASRWVDIDATLPDAGFDAAHIGLGVSTLGGSDRINTLATIAPLLGALSIEVESTSASQRKDPAK